MLLLRERERQRGRTKENIKRRLKQNKSYQIFERFNISTLSDSSSRLSVSRKTYSLVSVNRDSDIKNESDKAKWQKFQLSVCFVYTILFIIHYSSSKLEVMTEKWINDNDRFKFSGLYQFDLSYERLFILSRPVTSEGNSRNLDMEIRKRDFLDSTKAVS